MNASKYDAVLSLHMNPLTCGVAKFNHELACRLGVPCAALNDRHLYDHPLVSVKPQELGNHWLWLNLMCRYDLFLHDRTLPMNHQWLVEAEAVFYADELGCPSTLAGHGLRRGSIHVLTFGMANKRCLPLFTRLRDLLDATGQSYTVGVSSAIHEGSPWSETWAASDRALRAIFGDHLRQYGFMADDGLVTAIEDADVVALFYEPAVRANNTTLWAALDRASVVVTNLDEQSPAALVHGETVYDLAQLTAWPTTTHPRIGWAGQALAREQYGWPSFLEKLARVPVQVVAP